MISLPLWPREPFILFSLPCPVESRNYGVALVGAWHPARVNPLQSNTMTIFKLDNCRSFPRTSMCWGFLPSCIFNATQESSLCIRQYNKHCRASGACSETQSACNTKWKRFTLIELCFTVGSLQQSMTSFSPIPSTSIHVSKLLCQVSFVISH